MRMIKCFIFTDLLISSHMFSKILNHVGHTRDVSLNLAFGISASNHFLYTKFTVPINKSEEMEKIFTISSPSFPGVVWS